MILRALTLGFLLTLPTAGWSQSLLRFARLFPLTELPTTGFTVVNPNISNATVTFALITRDGRELSRSDTLVPAKGQLSKLGSELFPSVGAGGWVEVTSTATGIRGFWLGGDFATYADGADAAVSLGDAVFPFVNAQTEINIVTIATTATTANPASAPVANQVNFSLRGLNGTVLATAVRIILFRAGIQERVSDLFPEADTSQAAYIRVSATQPFIGSSVIRGLMVNTETAVLNALPYNSLASHLNFVQVVSGPSANADYSTLISVINVASSAQTITLTFNPEPTGTPVVVQRALPPGGLLRESAEAIFGFSGSFRTGWVKVSALSPITGAVAYAERSSGGFSAVPVQESPELSIFFGHIAGLPAWYTGIGLLNDSNTDANVEVFAISAAGELIAGPSNAPTARFTIPAGRKTTKLLSELIPETASQNGGFVYVRTTNNVPLYGIELFGSTTGPILLNVAASGLLPGRSFTPPSLTEPLILSSLFPVRAARRQTLTLNGNGFSLTASTIVFTTVTGTVEVRPDFSTVTVLTASVPREAISGPVVVRSRGQSTAPLVVEVTDTVSALIQNLVTVSEAQTTSGADIYVPPPASALNAIAVGIRVPNQTILVGPYSPELPRGQTTTLVVVGPSIGLASGSTVSISGGGITILNPGLVEGGFLMEVRVDSDATVGPRTIFVRNSNLDTTPFTGGFYVK